MTIATADERAAKAAELIPLVKKILARPANENPSSVACELNRYGIRTPGGGYWNGMNIRKLIRLAQPHAQTRHRPSA